MAFTKITASGIGSTETVTLDGLSVINDGSFGGNVSVGGTLTYEDVTNIDSVGLITARAGVVVGSGITLSKDGDIFATGVTTATSFVGDGSQLTGVASTENIRTNTNATFLQNVNVSGTTTAAGNINVSGANITLGDSGGASDDRIVFGAGSDLQLYHNGSHSIISNSTGTIFVLGDSVSFKNAANNEVLFYANADNEFAAYHNNSKKIETTSSGITVTGTVAATSYTGDGSGLTGIGGTSFIHAEQVNVSGVVTATGLVGNFAPRNMIINGAMQINQRQHGTETVNSSSSKYPCDRWVSRGEGGSKTFTIEKTSVASAGLGVRNALKVTSSQAASLSSSDIFNVRQMIEGFNTQRLNLGEAGCASMTLSFTAYSSVAGTHSGAIQNSGQNKSYPFTYTLAANTWTDVKITIPPITSGSFNESTGIGLRVVFDMGSGNNFRGTANQWNSAQDEGATGAVRLLETNGATWYVTKVQLEEGTVATPFEKKLVDEELRNCQRYFEGVFMNDGTASFKSYGSYGGSSNFEYQMKVEKRAIPTFSLEGDAGWSGATPNAYESRSSVAFQVNNGTLFSLGDGSDNLCASFDAEIV